MKKKFLYYIVLFVATLCLFPSCEKWLDVTTKTQNREDDQFSTVDGFKQALTGCYVNIVSSSLYSSKMVFELPEVLGQQYSLDPYNDLSYLGRYDYTNSTSISMIESVWSNAYNAIANINNILSFCEKNRSVLDDVNYALIKGELLTMRAFIHFDLMRLFGYSNLQERTDLDTKKTIPYMREVTKDIIPQESYNVTLNLMIEDLNNAISLLSIDPITKSEPTSFYEEANRDGYWNDRNQRFNYYVAKTTLAKVYMWRGRPEDKAEALIHINDVIEETEANQVISWVSSIAGLEADPVMKSEHILSLVVTNLWRMTSSRFAKNDEGTEFFYQNALLRTQIFSEYASNDIRYVAGYYANTRPEDTYIPKKYLLEYSINSTTGQIVNTTNAVGLLRIPELYYMAAECYATKNQPDMASALDKLNFVREKRGLGDYPLTEAEINDPLLFQQELTKEYKKEFIAEGVFFFYCKRNGLNIDDMSLTDSEYMLPYPDNEISMGREQ